MGLDLVAHLKRQIGVAAQAFGPGTRRNGVIAHIRKELAEIENAQSDIEAADEFIDVVILGFDGCSRALRAYYGDNATNGQIASVIAEKLEAKQDKNERRVWPDWRGKTQDEPIEHVRGVHD